MPPSGIEPRIDSPVPMFMPQATALENPVPSSPESIERGKYVYDIYCAVCHGPDGLASDATTPLKVRLTKRGDADRPPGESMVPIPLSNVPAYKDGQLFTKIRYGKPAMPGYPQIPPQDRWHVVNYLRTLIKGS